MKHCATSARLVIPGSNSCQPSNIQIHKYMHSNTFIHFPLHMAHKILSFKREGNVCTRNRVVTEWHSVVKCCLWWILAISCLGGFEGGLFFYSCYMITFGFLHRGHGHIKMTFNSQIWPSYCIPIWPSGG